MFNCKSSQVIDGCLEDELSGVCICIGLLCVLIEPDGFGVSALQSFRCPLDWFVWLVSRSTGTSYLQGNQLPCFAISDRNERINAPSAPPPSPLSRAELILC